MTTFELPQVIVVCGVSGSGKSTVGSMLAELLERTFIDADQFHPPQNIAKMASGVPLTDDDRWEWLDQVGRASATQNCVLACSALGLAHRERLRRHCTDTLFVQLKAPSAEISHRLVNRIDHFMSPTLLMSQESAFEQLSAQERGFTVDATLPPHTLISEIVEAFMYPRRSWSSSPTASSEQ